MHSAKIMAGQGFCPSLTQMNATDCMFKLKNLHICKNTLNEHTKSYRSRILNRNR